MKALIILLLFTGQLFAQERPAYPEILQEYCENYQPEELINIKTMIQKHNVLQIKDIDDGKERKI